MRKGLDSSLPTSKKWLVDGFRRYSRRMVAKQFHALGVQPGPLSLDNIPSSTPIIVYANHAGWWDPIVASQLCHQYLPSRVLYAPIDSDALAKYRIMESLGFYGVKLQTLEGAASFLARTKTILTSDNASVWITPEGRFCDVRDLSQPLMPGLAHLATKSPQAMFVPLAIEYCFWDEPRPLILTRFGDAVPIEASMPKDQCNALLTTGLRSTQRDLATDAIARDKRRFQFIIGNSPKRLSWYDFFRSWKARINGTKFDPRHSVDDEPT